MVELAILAGFLFLLGIGGFVADYIFPHIPWLNRYIDALPMMQEGVDILEKEEAPYEQTSHRKCAEELEKSA